MCFYLKWRTYPAETGEPGGVSPRTISKIGVPSGS